MSLGSRIRRARKQLKLTQPQVGSVCGVKPQAVWQWEHDRTVPESKNLMLLARLFKVPIDWLTNGPDGYVPAPDELWPLIDSLPSHQRAAIRMLAETFAQERTG